MSLDFQKSKKKYESLDLDRAQKYSYYTINTLKINRELLQDKITHYLIYKVSFNALDGDSAIFLCGFIQTDSAPRA